MRELACEIADDQEACEFYPGYGGVAGQEPRLHIGQRHEGALSLAGWLTECAEHLEAGPSFDALVIPFEGRRGNSLKAFVIRGVYYLISMYFASGRELEIVTAKQPRMTETALLASAVLGKKVTENDVTQVRKKERRKYVLD